MIHRVLHIRSKWRVDVFIDNDDSYDYSEVIGCLNDMNASDWAMDKVERHLDKDSYNEAFTYSKGRRTCIFIGKTTDGREFLNSLVHELRHLVDHIADYYGWDNSEAVGYLSGDMAFELAEDICRLGCTECRKFK